MSLSAGERRVLLLAAAASPLERVREQWWRTDPPAALGAQSDGEHRWARVDTGAVQGLIRRGLLELSARTWLSDSAVLTEAGLEEAKGLRSVLGRRKRELLRLIDGALGEVVLSADGWVAPGRGVVSRLNGQPYLLRPRPICGGHELQDLVARGLVALLAGTRAVLTGAGQWCAEEGAQDGETASEGAQGPSTGVSR